MKARAAVIYPVRVAWGFLSSSLTAHHHAGDWVSPECGSIASNVPSQLTLPPDAGRWGQHHIVEAMTKQTINTTSLRWNTHYAMAI